MHATVLENPDLENADSFSALKEQIEAKKNNALQERKTKEVPFQPTPRNSEQMGEGTEGEEGADDSLPKNLFRFQKGEETFDLDSDAILEFKADGKPIKMSLKQMRDAAAGGIAVRNRMRQLSEQKKQMLDPFISAGKKAVDNPLGALKQMFAIVQKVNPDLDFKQFLQGLGKQAQGMAKMAPSEREAFELKQQLEEEREVTSKVMNEAKVQRLSMELMNDTGLSEDKIFEYGNQILTNPILKGTVKDEEDLFTRIGDLAEEVELQQASYNALKKFNPKATPRDPLVFELSKVLRQNPDFDERDLLDLAKGVVNNVQRTDAARVLSKRHKSAAVNYKSPEKDLSRLSPFEALKAQIQERKEQHKKR
jgi:hypothetical protein